MPFANQVTITLFANLAAKVGYTNHYASSSYFSTLENYLRTGKSDLHGDLQSRMLHVSTCCHPG